MSIFPPIPLYPNDYDGDETLFLVYNTAEALTVSDTLPYADEIEIRPRHVNQPEIWADNGYANISGELFYYSSVTKNNDERVCKLKGCLRAVGGDAPRFNSAGTWVRGYVVAEHHNQLVDATLLIENFIGENFSEDPETLDWRIRHLADSPIIADDFGCPDIQFDFRIVSSSPVTGTRIRYTVSIAGDASGFTLQFGDGSFTNLARSGEHLYAPGSSVNPVIIIQTDSCQIVQTPITPGFTGGEGGGGGGGGDIPPSPGGETPIVTVPDIEVPFSIVVPQPPAIPKFVIPPLVSFIPEIILPPFVMPCFPSIVMSGGSGFPSTISLVGTIPSVITFGSSPLPESIPFGSNPLPASIPFGSNPLPSMISIVPDEISLIMPAGGIPINVNCGCGGGCGCGCDDCGGCMSVIYTNCCSVVGLPRLLYATIENAIDACSCLIPLDFTMEYDGAADVWEALVNTCSAPYQNFKFWCGGVGDYSSYNMAVDCITLSGIPMVVEPSAGSCDPWTVTFTFDDPEGVGCCGGSGSFDVTLSQTESMSFTAPRRRRTASVQQVDIPDMSTIQIVEDNEPPSLKAVENLANKKTYLKNQVSIPVQSDKVISKIESKSVETATHIDFLPEEVFNFTNKKRTEDLSLVSLFNVVDGEVPEPCSIPVSPDINVDLVSPNEIIIESVGEVPYILGENKENKLPYNNKNNENKDSVKINMHVQKYANSADNEFNCVTIIPCPK